VELSGKRISILGSNSYIGAHLTKQLIDLKCELFLYDKCEQSIFPQVNYKQFDILNIKEINKIELDVDALFLFSGITGTTIGFEKYKDFIDINEIGLLNLLDAIKIRQFKTRVVYPSSRLVYKGYKNKMLKETGKKEPKTIYALNKFNCEEYLKIYHRCFNINYTILRICIPYGHYIKNLISYGTINHFLTKAEKGEDIIVYGNGLQKRTFTHIEDLCNVLILSGFNPSTNNDIFNVGGKDILSLFEIAQYISKAYQVGIKLTQWDSISAKIESGDTVFDSTKLDSIIKYQYKYNFADWMKYHVK